MIRQKIFITLFAIAVVVATATYLNDYTYGLWAFICILVGFALSELWRLKKSTNQ